MLHGACVGEEARAPNLVFFRVKWLHAALRGTLCVCAAVAAAIVSSSNRFSLGVLQRVVVQCCSCVRSSLRFLNLWLQIAFEWLHDCCHLVLSYA